VDEELDDRVPVDRLALFLAAISLKRLIDLFNIEASNAQEVSQLMVQYGWAMGIIEVTDITFGGSNHAVESYAELGVHEILDELGVPTLPEIKAKETAEVEVRRLESYNMARQWFLNGEMMEKCRELGSQSATQAWKELRIAVENL